jgi:uncharacterized protein YdcH (DUF465 family)
MQSSMLSHSLAVEFPELAETFHQLKVSDKHFAHLLEQHDAIDQRISRDEAKLEPVGDDMLHSLKQQRLKLKDEMYRMASAA